MCTIRACGPVAQWLEQGTHNLDGQRHRKCGFSGAKRCFLRSLIVRKIRRKSLEILGRPNVRLSRQPLARGLRIPPPARRRNVSPAGVKKPTHQCPPLPRHPSRSAHPGFLWVARKLPRLSMPSRRKFAAGILPFAHSKKTSLRHRGFARFPTPLDWHGQPLRPTEFPEGPPVPAGSSTCCGVVTARSTRASPTISTDGSRRTGPEPPLDTPAAGSP